MQTMMRKKTMAFLMAGMMIFGGTMPVFAETETQSGSDTIVWSYEDIDPELYEGCPLTMDLICIFRLNGLKRAMKRLKILYTSWTARTKKYPWQLPVIHQKTWEPKPNWTQ